MRPVIMPPWNMHTVNKNIMSLHVNSITKNRVKTEISEFGNKEVTVLIVKKTYALKEIDL